MSYLDPDLSQYSPADLLAMIEWIESEKSFYGDLIQCVKGRLKDELDYRILGLVKNSDKIRESE